MIWNFAKVYLRSAKYKDQTPYLGYEKMFRVKFFSC